MNKIPGYISSFVAILFLLMMPTAHAAYEQRIYYAGMSCSAVQKDSVVKPANEIFIHTHVRQLSNGKVRSQSHPSSSPGYYKKVTKGYGTPARTLIWQGRQQPVELRVTMWEYDDGGTAVHVFSNYLTLAIARKAGKQLPGSKVSYGKNHTTPEFRSAGSNAKASGPSNDPVTSLFNRLAIMSLVPLMIW